MPDKLCYFISDPLSNPGSEFMSKDTVAQRSEVTC